jgi:hypothetical protein
LLTTIAEVMPTSLFTIIQPLFIFFKSCCKVYFSPISTS